MSYTGTYDRAGVHVGDSDVTCIRKVATRLQPWRIEYQDARKRFFREQLEIHHNAQALVREWRM